ncbi:hypothetical protein GCM10009660_26370 [Catellatospora bangladeshensis]
MRAITCPAGLDRLPVGRVGYGRRVEHRGPDAQHEGEIDPAQVKRNVRLVVARLRQRLTAAGNPGLFQALRDGAAEGRSTGRHRRVD